MIFLCGFGLIAGGLFYLTQSPLPPAPRLAQTTFIYDAKGGQLASFHVQNRIDVRLAQVPKVVIDAVVSTEDRHFFTEGALNPVSMVRALISDLSGGGTLQGGSTITQQYVKQAYLSPQRTLTRKIKEAAIAVRLERTESKDQILQGYLNTIYWGRSAYGVDAASEAYFGKPVGQIGLREASLLAGLIREPETADPAHDPALARLNQDDTLRAMVRDKDITPAQAAQVERTPFSAYVLAPGAPGAPGAQVANVPGAPYFVAAVRAQLVAAYGAAMVDGGGLRVTTTLDPTLEAEAYNAVYGPNRPALDPAAGDPSGALVSVDDQGDVVAMVGGQHYAASQVDLALGDAGGGSGRQAGSTFKAFMLARVIKSGYSVESTFPAPTVVVVPHGNADGSPWTVKNFAGDQPNPHLSLLNATVNSINTVYAQVVERLGPKSLDTMAEAFGISAKELAGAYPSQVLGSALVSPLEMAGAYAGFANGGTYNTPVLITKVTRADGAPLPLPVRRSSRQVLDARQVAILDDVLRQVVQRGTGQAAGGLGTPVAGKTGTTDSSADAWFVGYTPKLATAMWMGYPQGSKPMVDFRGQSTVVGGGTPAQIWHAFMAAALASDPQYRAAFPPVSSLGGTRLTPPALGTVEYPNGTGATTTTAPPTTAPPTTAATPVVRPGTPVTTLARPATTAPSPSPTTVPPTTTTQPTTPSTLSPPPTT